MGKELSLFFASPSAYLFLGSFAAVTLFVFFWVESFFARNIADVRPLFEWMPVLLIFLASTLTMRLWSEERRTGTLEYVHAQPVALWYFVVGKFLACLALLVAALMITLPLPVTVALLGELDWGPVWAGYLATFLLGAAYLSIGLFISARSDNQIVSLISATAVCSVFYLIGTSTITDFLGTRAGEWLRLLGTGSRFESITRGVIDVRDLYYYASLVAVFLVLNTFVLERERWAQGPSRPRHRGALWLAVLLVANAVAGNLWLGQVKVLRADVTEGGQYSISPATDNYLRQLREPLLIRGYFSSQTHPLLAPLVPRLEDLLREYEVAADGRVRVEIIDPAEQPALEEEANRQFGIRPVPFQVADRYQSSIVSSYFNLLIHYGDEYQVLGFQDLVEVKAGSESNIEVQLRNPQYDITRAIKHVLRSYQAGGNLFDTVTGRLTFTAYVSPDEQLPQSLRDFRSTIARVVNDFGARSEGRLGIEFVDPDAGEGTVARQIVEEFGFQPMSTGLFSDQRFFFYLTVSDGNTLVQVPLEDMSEEGFRRNLEAGIKRFASGFTKTVALVTPAPDPMYASYARGGAQFNQLESFLGASLNLVSEDLTDGQVSGEVDLLLLLAPDLADDRSLFAIDQFLMQGGTVVLATSPFSTRFNQGSLALQQHHSGLADWLQHHGLDIASQLVLDPRSGAFPLPVTRNVAGFQVQEVLMQDYPYFIDIRDSGLNADNAITADLHQVGMAWASPITVNQDAGKSSRRITELLRSSEHAWLSASTNVMPALDANGAVKFPPRAETGSHLLGVISEGRFESFFAGKDSPLLPRGGTEDEAEPERGDGTVEPSAPARNAVYGVIERSTDAARVILFSSNDFLKDTVIGMAGMASGGDYLGSLQLMANAVDWSLEDRGLLSIGSRGYFNRTLPPMPQRTQVFWEYLNYALAALTLGAVALFRYRRQRVRKRLYLEYA